jgi:hypothetical protein
MERINKDGKMKKIFILCSFLLFSTAVSAQVLISLLLGDKLNTGKIEFGLDGGVNFSSLSGIDHSKSLTGFHLGFYFDFKLKNDWILHTGVIVKSPLGASGITPYPLNDQNLDSAFEGGEVKRKLQYFNVPVMMKYVFHNQLFMEAGFQLGLLHKANDEFTQKINEKDDLNYKLSIKDDYHPLDAGLAAGIGYRLMKGNGMNLAVRYYYGLVDITIDDTGKNNFNRSLYLAVGIPIGAGKAKKREDKKTN